VVVELRRHLLGEDHQGRAVERAQAYHVLLGRPVTGGEHHAQPPVHDLAGLQPHRVAGVAHQPRVQLLGAQLGELAGRGELVQLQQHVGDALGAFFGR
jgi:hypothetical protein